MARWLPLLMYLMYRGHNYVTKHDVNGFYAKNRYVGLASTR
jgi:hypothetical protein